MLSHPIHKQEREQFIKLFQDDHIDDFEDRLKVLEVFLQTERHVTADELWHLVRQQGHGLDLDFVRETLRLMCRYGFAQQARFENGQLRYEHRHLGQHHDHMICTKCKKIIEFENQAIEKLQAEVAASYGFHMLQHRLELYGICARCLKERRASLSLDAAKPGERLLIKEFRGGAKSKMRLMTMGLRIGDQIDVITNQGQGQVVVALGYKRLALGRGLAAKIRVAACRR